MDDELPGQSWVIMSVLHSQIDQAEGTSRADKALPFVCEFTHMEEGWKGPLPPPVPQREEEMGWKTGSLGRNLRKGIKQNPVFPFFQKSSKLPETQLSLCFPPLTLLTVYNL